LLSNVSLSNFIFCVINEPEASNGFFIIINTQKCWSNDHIITDHYTDEEWDVLRPVLSKYNLIDTMESIYESNMRFTPDKMTQLLLAEGLQQDSLFTQWCKTIPSFY